MYNFKKKERAKEVKELEQKIENLTADVEATESDIKALNQEKADAEKARNQVRESKEQAEKELKHIEKQRNQLQPIINSIDKELKNSGQIKLVLPEVGTLELASTYRNKKIKPLFTKMKNYIAGLAAKVIELSREAEKWRNKYQQLKKDYDNLEKIGSVRSCRDYYIFYASGFDAIYTHYGQSAYALPFLELPEVNNISGLAGYGDQVFYRTTDRKSPHNAYTSFEGIQKGIEINGYSQEYAEDFQPGYAFCGVDDEVELPGETEANVVKPGYFLNEPWFEYNPEDKLYYRFQYGDKQIDQLTGEQIAYKNIILQYSSWRKYDENGYLNIDVDEPNVGKYIVNGKAIDITWKKHAPWGATFYYDTNGNQITMDTGKTWVCIIQDTYADRVEILGSDDSSASSTDTQDSEAQAAAEEAAASDTEY